MAILATGVELHAALAPPTAHVLELGAGNGALAVLAIWIAVVPGDLPGLRCQGSVEIGSM